ncbi:MAG: aminotransferase class I/II-fold pyridoxal phosphate-dependent enzyme [Spirochaetia bacterium]|nr:aminotransferase class I/II-fold pyridoxal phosphate-dependent enzyme [Spirochaetia bacterium]
MEIKTSNRINQIDSSEIRKIFDLAGKLKNPKNLSIGQPDFPVPDVVKNALIQAVYDNKNSYTQTQGILPLREKLSQQWLINGIDIKPENILISAGVASILYLLFDVLFNSGDEILIIEPYFLVYESLSVFHNLKVTCIPENFDEKYIENLLSRTNFKPKVILFSSPSNPTGRIIMKEQIVLLGKIAEKHDSLIIADEIYSAFDYDKKFCAAASVIPERTISLGGFSKSHAMTGLRVGYIGVHEKLTVILQKMSALQQYSIVCSPTPSQWAALVALDHPLSIELDIFKKRRDRVVELLKGRVNFPFPDGAFYVFPEIPIDSRDFIKKAIEAELLIVPGYIFTKNSKTVRISYAQREDLLEEGLKIFIEILESVK